MTSTSCWKSLHFVSICGASAVLDMVAPLRELLLVCTHLPALLQPTHEPDMAETRQIATVWGDFQEEVNLMARHDIASASAESYMSGLWVGSNRAGRSVRVRG
ncbi:unnamed protein product, partial [Ectocarpus sp. 13 AM-2016]